MVYPAGQYNRYWGLLHPKWKTAQLAQIEKLLGWPGVRDLACVAIPPVLEDVSKRKFRVQFLGFRIVDLGSWIWGLGFGLRANGNSDPPRWVGDWAVHGRDEALQRSILLSAAAEICSVS